MGHAKNDYFCIDDFSTHCHCHWQTQFGLLAWVINFVVPLCLAMCFAVAKLGIKRRREWESKPSFYINYFSGGQICLCLCTVQLYGSISTVDTVVFQSCSIIHQGQGAFCSNLRNVCGNVCSLGLSPTPLRRSTVAPSFLWVPFSADCSLPELPAFDNSQFVCILLMIGPRFSHRHCCPTVKQPLLQLLLY